MLDIQTLKDKFATQSKTIYVKAVDDEVRIRKLSIAQRARVDEIMFDGVVTDSKGEVPISINNYRKATKLAISFALIEPEMSLKDLDELGDDSVKFIDEIYNALSEFDKAGKLKAGKSTSK